MSRAVVLGLAFSAAVPLSVHAAPDLSGYWVLKSDPDAVPAAASTPAAARKVRELLDARGLDAPNGSPAYARVWCTPQGMPQQMTGSLPIRFSQGPLTLTMTYSVKADPRHIYIDGQPQADADTFDATSTGNSVGRWQGDTLVVSTRYMQSGILVIPGGALRSDKSRLVERFRLVGPDTLRVTSTWTDPTTLRRPHSYTYEYSRAPGQVWMTEARCNPVRAMRAKGLHVPYDAQD